MSRRKQARPIRHLEEDGVTPVGTSPTTSTNSMTRNDTVTAVIIAEGSVGESADVAASPEPATASSASVEPIITGASTPINTTGATVNSHSHNHTTNLIGDNFESSDGDDSPICQEEEESALYGDTLMCPRCQEQFTDVQEFLTHKEQCALKAIKHEEPAHSDPEDMVVSEEDDDDDEESGGKRMERMRRHRQDAANNNSVEEATSPEDNAEARLGFPFQMPTGGEHVTLEALQNTKVAVAQFAATALANASDNETALQDLAVLQSTLFTLQHQQVLQLQLINQLQQQLSLNKSKPGSPASTSHETDTEVAPVESPPPPPPPPPPQQSVLKEPSPPPTVSSSSMRPIQPPQHTEPAVVLSTPVNTTLSLHIQTPVHCCISSSLASTIITHNNDPPSLDAPNTLEMLQKRAQEVLDNASQGLLATNLADELAFRRSKGSMSPFDSKGRNEPFFKHRCRYCGKVFGSDSALQIHIRSHTGERPFKCNVCGSRFTTKGNLKVHFQRHSSKFPHIKMNPNPIPEHLDKYHPPLLAQLGQSALSPGGPSSHPPPLGFPGSHPFPPAPLPLYRPPVPPPHELISNRLMPSPHHTIEASRPFPPHPLFLKRDEQEAPENLSRPIRSPTPPPVPLNISETNCKKEPNEEKLHDNIVSKQVASPDIEPITPKQEVDTDIEQERFPSPSPYDECSIDTKYSNEEQIENRSSPTNGGQSELMQDEPENLSSKSSLNLPLCISTAQKLPTNFPFGYSGSYHKYENLATSPHSSTSSGSMRPFPTSQQLAELARDPALYANLLPRPGSNDNSWESLIEVTKTSETSKLQQLVDNIEHKLSDPNQCVICHRVLSCKSALQMHYRTHTGERPFMCKICRRAFTTKGNLKTHMGVHRTKPPMRMLHQCPVCHKKFTNALVLQQHIRLHTGEPTDLTPEQIQAAEVKDFPSPGGIPHMHSSMNPFLGQGFPGLSPIGPGGFPLGMRLSDFDRDMISEQDYNMDEEDDDDDDDINSENNMTSYSTSPGVDHSAIPNLSHNNLSQSGLFTAEDVCHSRTAPPTSPIQNGDKSPLRSAVTSPGSAEMRSSPSHLILPSTPVQNSRPPSVQPPQLPPAASPSPSESNSLGALDLTPKTTLLLPASSSPGPSPGPPSIFSTFGLMPPGSGTSPLMSSALSSLTSSVLTSTAFSPLRLAVGPVGMSLRGNTTCNLCFKTFACNSALEIHYRSHTKERPFKCNVCDRGFSTKESCVCEQRRIQEDAEQPVRASNRKSSSAQRKHITPSIFPLSASPGYATALHWNSLLTPGNMKQHMLTHKIRDMPQHMFDSVQQQQTHQGKEEPISLRELHINNEREGFDVPKHSPSNQELSIHQQQHSQQPSQLLPQAPPSVSLTPTPPLPPPSSIQQMFSQSSIPISLQTPLHLSSTPPMIPSLLQATAMQTTLTIQTQPMQATIQHPMPLPPEPMKQDQQSMKRAPQEADLPMPKRPPSGLQVSNKHLCHVCNKNFSSSSALQIHMRTHTGDKPFRCTVCQKAFTTKGNLKVHMGTHMWSNGASRRGRRMSLDLPPIPMTPKDTEFLQRRPDLFYPYLPAPFLNGMQQKLNEISVIQSGPPNGGGLAGKYSGLLGFGYPHPEALRSLAASSPEDHLGVGGRPSSPSLARESDRLWDLHFDRKSAGVAVTGNGGDPDSGHHHHHRGDDLLPIPTAPVNREGLAA